MKNNIKKENKLKTKIKAKTSSILGLLSIFIILFTNSCKNTYGTDNYFYRENNVDERISGIVELDDFVTDKDSLPDKYNILVLTDIHFGSTLKETTTELFYKDLDILIKEHPDQKPIFCFILGDNVDHGYEDEYKSYKRLVREIEKRGIKVASVLGNHDLFNSGWEFYKKYCYPYCSLFKFKTKNLSWYGIDTGTGTIGIKQYNLLKEAFEKDKKAKIILQHYPFANTNRQGTFSLHDSTEKNLMIDLYANNNVKADLCGHLHYTKTKDLTSFKEYGNPSFCFRDHGWTLYEVDEINAAIRKLE